MAGVGAGAGAPAASVAAGGDGVVVCGCATGMSVRGWTPVRLTAGGLLLMAALGLPAALLAAAMAEGEAGSAAAPHAAVSDEANA